MNRLTINLPAELHAALKAAAARCGTTIGALFRESLEAYGIKPEHDVRKLIAAARARTGLNASIRITSSAHTYRTKRCAPRCRRSRPDSRP